MKNVAHKYPRKIERKTCRRLIHDKRVEGVI